MMVSVILALQTQLVQLTGRSRKVKTRLTTPKAYGLFTGEDSQLLETDPSTLAHGFHVFHDLSSICKMSILFQLWKIRRERYVVTVKGWYRLYSRLMSLAAKAEAVID